MPKLSDNSTDVVKRLVGDRLRMLRKTRRLSQAVAAQGIGIARSSLASLERGHDLPGRNAIAAMARFYKVPIPYLMPAELPQAAQLVEDADELALLAFWRGLTTEERRLMLRLLGAAGRQAA